MSTDESKLQMRINVGLAKNRNLVRGLAPYRKTDPILGIFRVHLNDFIGDCKDVEIVEPIWGGALLVKAVLRRAPKEPPAWKLQGYSAIDYLSGNEYVEREPVWELLCEIKPPEQRVKPTGAKYDLGAPVTFFLTGCGINYQQLVVVPTMVLIDLLNNSFPEGEFFIVENKRVVDHMTIVLESTQRRVTFHLYAKTLRDDLPYIDYGKDDWQ